MDDRQWLTLNDIGDEGASKISQVLMVNTALIELYLRDIVRIWFKEREKCL